jgi:hypothetical protein
MCNTEIGVKISGSLVSDASLSARLGGLLFVLARLELRLTGVPAKKKLKNCNDLALKFEDCIF